MVPLEEGPAKETLSDDARAPARGWLCRLCYPSFKRNVSFVSQHITAGSSFPVLGCAKAMDSRQSVLPSGMEEAETWNRHETKLIIGDQTEK